MKRRTPVCGPRRGWPRTFRRIRRFRRCRARGPWLRPRQKMFFLGARYLRYDWRRSTVLTAAADNPPRGAAAAERPALHPFGGTASGRRCAARIRGAAHDRSRTGPWRTKWLKKRPIGRRCTRKRMINLVEHARLQDFGINERLRDYRRYENNADIHVGHYTTIPICGGRGVKAQGFVLSPGSAGNTPVALILRADFGIICV